jgi:hypothetical protein
MPSVGQCLIFNTTKGGYVSLQQYSTALAGIHLHCGGPSYTPPEIFDSNFVDIIPLLFLFSAKFFYLHAVDIKDNSNSLKLIPRLTKKLNARVSLICQGLIMVVNFGIFLAGMLDFYATGDDDDAYSHYNDTNDNTESSRCMFIKWLSLFIMKPMVVASLTIVNRANDIYDGIFHKKWGITSINGKMSCFQKVSMCFDYLVFGSVSSCIGLFLSLLIAAVALPMLGYGLMIFIIFIPIFAVIYGLCFVVVTLSSVTGIMVRDYRKIEEPDEEDLTTKCVILGGWMAFSMVSTFVIYFSLFYYEDCGWEELARSFFIMNFDIANFATTFSIPDGVEGNLTILSILIAVVSNLIDFTVDLLCSVRCGVNAAPIHLTMEQGTEMEQVIAEPEAEVERVITDPEVAVEKGITEPKAAAEKVLADPEAAVEKVTNVVITAN